MSCLINFMFYDLLIYQCTTGLPMYNFSFRAGGTKFGMPPPGIFSKIRPSETCFPDFWVLFCQTFIKIYYYKSFKNLLPETCQIIKVHFSHCAKLCNLISFSFEDQDNPILSDVTTTVWGAKIFPKF